MVEDNKHYHIHGRKAFLEWLAQELGLYPMSVISDLQQLQKDVVSLTNAIVADSATEGSKIEALKVSIDNLTTAVNRLIDLIGMQGLVVQHGKPDPNK